MIITGVAEADGGWRLRSTDRQPDLWGLEHGPARDFVRARLSDFTIRCFEQPLDAPTHAATTLTIAHTWRASVTATQHRGLFEPFARRAQEGWEYHALPRDTTVTWSCRRSSAGYS
jgi:hypothetical protein